jgi:16S rRNA C1402 (ribose-2'-O) methylase RsmI
MGIYRTIDALNNPITRVAISTLDPKPGPARYYVIVVQPGVPLKVVVFGAYRSQRIGEKRVDRLTTALTRAYVIFFDSTGQPWWIDFTGTELAPP